MKQYDHVRNFVKGLAGVRLKEKWGFINELDEEVIPCIYDGVGDFSLRTRRNFTKKLAEVMVGVAVYYVDEDLTYYTYTLPRLRRLPCESCKYFNDKLMTGLCCQFKEAVCTEFE